jgi:DNA-binding LacI/PurR family transcriptional regulator
VAEGTTKKRVTAADIARSLGISRATVGFVLNNTPGQTISKNTRQRVLAEASRLGYHPSRAAQALARGRSAIILFVLPDWPVEFTMRQYLEEAAHVLDEEGYSLVTYTRHMSDRTQPLWELLDPEVVVGMRPFDADELVSMRACGITKIYPAPDSAEPELPVLGTGPELQVRHLHDLGHQRLAYAALPDPRLAPLVKSREQDAQRAAALLSFDRLDVRAVDHRDESAREAVMAWHDAGVTGVVAYNDEAAATVVGAAVRAGIAVPDELAVIGVDDTPLASMFVPSLSTVRLDIAGVGRYVAQHVLSYADGRQRPTTVPDISAVVVERESTRKT